MWAEVKIGAFADRVAPFLFALQSFLACLQLLDAAGVEVNVVVHRMWELRRFELGVDLTLPLLLLLVFWAAWMIPKRDPRALVFPVIAVVVFPFLGFEAVVSLVLLIAVFVVLWLYRDLKGYLTGVFLILGVFEAFALLHWVFFVPLGLSSPFGSVAGLELELFYLASFLSPYLGLILVFISILKPLIRLLSGEGLASEGVERRSAAVISSKVLVSLVLVVSLSVVAAVYPYFPSVNPRRLDAGVDIRDYVESLELLEGNVSQAFYVMNGSRPMIFLALFGFQKSAGLDALTAVRFFPVILNPLLALSVFFLAVEVLGDVSSAIWAAFFTVCGYPVSVGMFSYFLANMLGLSLAFTSLGLLFMAMRSGNRVSLFLASLFGGLIVFAHPWTFDQYLFATFLTAGLIFYDIRVKGRNHGNVSFLIFYLMILGLSELLKVMVFHGVGGASASTTVLGGFTTLSKFLYDLEFFFKVKYNGYMSNLVLNGLANVGLLLYEFWTIPDIFFKVFLGLSSLGFLLGNEVIKSRLFYNTSIGLFAALGLLFYCRWEKSNPLRLAVVSFVVLNMAVYLFRSLANLI